MTNGKVKDRSKNKEVAEREKRRKEWEEHCEYYRNEDTPLKRYCRQIRGVKAHYELTFDEYNEQYIAHERKVDDGIRRVMSGFKRDAVPKENRVLVVPERMTKKAWLEQIRRDRKEAKEAKKQAQADDDFKRKMAPVQRLEDDLQSIEHQFLCECTAESIRRGEFCSICRLIARTHEYMLNIFRYTAERSKK